ncbi:MAG TPA: TolC family protein [Thermoanaerobaculia bacterium]|nr:TolC family protein [Thermoanaerobaculia bacterium]
MRFLSLFFAFALCVTLSAAQELPTSVHQAEIDPVGELTLETALSLATTRSPEVAAAESALRAMEGRVIQAGARPNPELSGTAENLGGNAAITGGLQSTVELGQRFELGGDRAARTAAAGAALDLTRWDLELRRIEATSRATRAFYEVLYAQRAVELADQSANVAEEVRATVAARVEAGKVSPIEETKAEVALATERIERARAAAHLIGARSRLAATWGGSTPTFSRVAGDVNGMPPIPSLESVMTLLEGNPEVARWSAEIAEREALLRVERARGVPDVTVVGGYRHFELGDSAFVARVALPLPLFDRNRGAQIEARERIAGAELERRAAVVRLRQLAEETHVSLSRAEGEVRSLREEVVPGAESVYSAVSEGYRLGKFGYLEVLDARRTLATARGQLVRAQAELQRAFADLQRLTTTPMTNISNGAQP